MSAARSTLRPHHAALAACALLATACTTQPSHRQEAVPARDAAARGYAAAEHLAIASSSAAWTVSEQTIALQISQPVRSGTVPVVIYLPGLGETSQAGARWRTAWAAAGYAVLSVQPLEEDANAWKSALARAGEFKTLGRQRYSGTAMNRRVHLLRELVAEGRRRAGSGESPWQHLDWNRIAIAGFDLGAYTCMTLAGEHVPDVDDTTARWPIRAAIALSPYEDAAAGGADARYADIDAPVLSVTSDVDNDPLGLGDGASRRDAPYMHMPGPGKYLLSLQGLPHAALSGSPGQGSRADTAPPQRPPSANGDDTGKHRRGGKRGGSGDNASGAKPAREGSRNGEDAGRAGLSASELTLRLTAAEGVTTAFLDGYLKDDPLAREWLATDAGRWLGSTGQWRHK